MKSMFYKIIFRLGFALISIALKRKNPKEVRTMMDIRIKYYKEMITNNIDPFNINGDDSISVFDCSKSQNKGE